jgi:CheY-like chemotaxis protein
LESTTNGGLAGRRVLVVEDEFLLVKQLKAIFQEQTQVDLVVARCAEEAHRVVSDVMSGTAAPFDLAVMDVMLPWTVTSLEAVDDARQKAHKLYEKIAEFNSTGDDDEEPEGLAEARFQRAEQLKRIQDNIVLDGGILLVEEWTRLFKAAMPPVVYLTAISNPADQKRGKGILGLASEWLVKPVSGDHLLRVCAKLLDGRRAR